MTAPAARSLRHSPDRRPGLVVDGGAVPEWVLRWCGRSGRTVRAHTAQAIALAARTGDSVVVLRADPLAERPRVVAALRGLPDDAAVLADAIDAVVHLRGSLTLVHGVPLSFGERSVGLSDALRRSDDLLLDARALVDAAGADLPVDRWCGRGRTSSSANSSTRTSSRSAVPVRVSRAASAWSPPPRSATRHARCCLRRVPRPVAGPDPVPT